MSRTVDPRQLLVGIEGLALLRHLYDGPEEWATERLAEVRRLIDDPPPMPPDTIEEVDARSGYALWSGRYEEPGNPIVCLEEPAVWALVDRRPAGRALDAACGTGRHGVHLAELGHDVVAFDLTREMLGVARRRGSAPPLLEADVTAIPLADETFDLAVCGLALAHVSDLEVAGAELARVLRRGGHLVMSVLHPMQALLGWQAPFEDSAGNRRFIREHPHTHADYLGAFERAGLHLAACVEPALARPQIRAKRRAWRVVPDAALAAYQGMPAVLVLDLEKRLP